jgi:hypothetical protein
VDIACHCNYFLFTESAATYSYVTKSLACQCRARSLSSDKCNKRGTTLKTLSDRDNPHACRSGTLIKGLTRARVKGQAARMGGTGRGIDNGD